jgi:haloalkane dehalogenase
MNRYGGFRMKVLRTPDTCFDSLPGYEFEPHYVEVPAGDGSNSALRVHYLDEGPWSSGGASAPRPNEVVVLLHGELSWSYLYRKIVLALVSEGFRVIAPDLVGFGRSDKPAARTDYTYARTVEWMRAALFDHLQLEGITMVGHDWGGLVGLRLLTDQPARFRRVVLTNTAFPTGDELPSLAFLDYQKLVQEITHLPVGRLVASACTKTVADEVKAAYDAPFPDESYKEGTRQLAFLVPTSIDNPATAENRRAWEVLSKLDTPFLCAFSDSDPVTKGFDRRFVESVPGAQGQPHVTIADSGHFVQEDNPRALTSAVVDFVRLNPVI